ncbi:hypothetical protein D083_2161 [Dickeya solani RNS 08.23.3.1.A]|nr:hypothetical protein D083_2161 [Dickeya solani RNS 08.23.3.1.A]
MHVSGKQGIQHSKPMVGMALLPIYIHQQEPRFVLYAQR